VHPICPSTWQRNPDLSDFFGEDGGVDEDEDPVDDGVVVEGGTGVAVGANIPSTLEVPPGNRRVSDLSSAGSTATKKKTRTNLLVSALEDSTCGTASAMTSIMQQRQLAEEAEWRFRRMEWEDERIRREEERLELRRRREEAEEERRRERDEDRRRREDELHQQQLRDSRQQEHLDRMMQLALSGLITYMGMKVPRNDSDEK
jgi:hypothetical protein